MNYLSSTNTSCTHHTSGRSTGQILQKYIFFPLEDAKEFTDSNLRLEEEQNNIPWRTEGSRVRTELPQPQASLVPDSQNKPDPNFQFVFRKDGTGGGTHFPQCKLLHLPCMLSLHPGRLSKAFTEAWKKRALSVHTSTARSAAFFRDQRKKICTTPGEIRATLNQSD